MSEVEVLVTGLVWMGGGFRSIESALNELLCAAQEELLITAYAIGNASDNIFDKLRSPLERGVKIHLIVNRLEKQPHVVVKSLKDLAILYPYFHLYTFESNEEIIDLHAKTIVADRKKALVGSANISYRGWTTNYELAVLITGQPALEIAKAIDRLRFSTFCQQVS